MAKRIEISNDLRPTYYDDFHCLAAGCYYSCCKGWSVTFNKKDYLSLKRQKGSPELNGLLESSVRRIRKGPEAGSSYFYGEFDMSSGACSLLREDGLCGLQVEKGHEALPMVCRVFPRVTAYLPSGYLERGLSPACEGVLELMWNLPEGVEFVSDPLPKAERRVLNFREDHSLPVYFGPIREWCIDMLQDRRYPLKQRILLVGMALEKLKDGEEDVAAWLHYARNIAECGDELPACDGDPVSVAKFLIQNVRTLLQLQYVKADFASIPLEILGGVGVSWKSDGTSSIPWEPYLESRARYEERFGDQDYFIENLMVSLFFILNMPLLGSREELWKGYVGFCNLYSFYRFMAVMSCREGAAGDRAEINRLLVYASRSLIHNGAQRSFIRDEFFQNDSSTLAHMAILLCG